MRQICYRARMVVLLALTFTLVHCGAKGCPLSLYDSSWKAQTTLSNEKEAKVVLTSPSGKAITLVMSRDRGSWKVDWKKANPFAGMKRAR